jgi:hypothetical protein
MDPKLFSAAHQQGMNMNANQNQPNPNMMMPFQQQQQPQQQQDLQQQFNPLAGLALGFNFGQNDFSGGLDQDLGGINPFMQANPSLMGMGSLAQQQQQQHLRQTSHPQSVYSPQNLMGLQGNNSPGNES